MIKKIKLFYNDNEICLNVKKEIENKLINKGYVIDEEDYDLAIAIGGDGSFLRMIKNTNFNSDIYYIGINGGTLGFMQEVKVDEVDLFIDELINNKYKIEELGIQETIVYHNNETSRFYSLNEIIIRDKDLKVVKLNINVEGGLLEKYIGDGLLIATSTGSTAHNLSFGGSIVYNTFTSLQITPIAPLNSKVYRSLLNSVIIPDKKEIEIIPSNIIDDYIVTVDGENNVYDSVEKVTTIIDDKKIKCLRLSHYNFSEKIKEKLLND